MHNDEHRWGATNDARYARIMAKSDALMDRQHQHDAATSIILTRTSITTLTMLIVAVTLFILTGQDIAHATQVIPAAIAAAPGIVSLSLRIRKFFQD